MRHDPKKEWQENDNDKDSTFYLWPFVYYSSLQIFTHMNERFKINIKSLVLPVTHIAGKEGLFTVSHDVACFFWE